RVERIQLQRPLRCVTRALELAAGTLCLGEVTERLALEVDDGKLHKAFPGCQKRALRFLVAALSQVPRAEVELPVMHIVGRADTIPQQRRLEQQWLRLRIGPQLMQEIAAQVERVAYIALGTRSAQRLECAGSEAE